MFSITHYGLNGDLFFVELHATTMTWLDPSSNRVARHTWFEFADMSMSLGTTLKHFDGIALVEGAYDLENAEVRSSVTSTLSLSSDDGK